MVVSGGSVLRGFFVVVVILLLGRLAVLFRRCFRRRSRLVLLLAGWLFLFLCHGMSPEKVIGPFVFLSEILSQENLRQDRDSYPLRRL